MKCSLAFLALGTLVSTTLAQPHFPEKTDDETDFVTIFDGTSLDEWEGDPVYWSLQDGELIGTITPETIVKENTFIIWRGGQPDNFELKLDVWISDRGNSGINYRSEELDGKPYRLRGYQMDIDGPNQWSGQNYEEKGRRFLALRGQVTEVAGDSIARQIGSCGDKEELTQFIRANEWNAYHIIAKDRTMIHMINGQVMSVVVDNDEENLTRSGLIGVQVHVGPPMQVKYRNIRIKYLD